MSFGLNETKSLASLFLDFGDWRIGLVCAKHITSLLLFNMIVSQSLNFPTFFNSSAEVIVVEKIKIAKNNIIFFFN